MTDGQHEHWRNDNGSCQVGGSSRSMGGTHYCSRLALPGNPSPTVHIYSVDAKERRQSRSGSLNGARLAKEDRR